MLHSKTEPDFPQLLRHEVTEVGAFLNSGLDAKAKRNCEKALTRISKIALPPSSPARAARCTTVLHIPIDSRDAYCKFLHDNPEKRSAPRRVAFHGSDDRAWPCHMH
jgi:hypothetical protein